MGYFIRYYSTDPQPIELKTVGSALNKRDKKYRIVAGDLYFGEDVLGEIEVCRRGDELFEDERDEFQEALDDREGGDPFHIEKVRDTLRRAQSALVVRVLSTERSQDDAVELLEPLWQWCFENRKGLLQVDDEGWYDAENLLLPDE